MATPMAASGRPIGKISLWLSTTLPPAVAQLMNLLSPSLSGRSILPGREIVSEGRPCSAVFLITEGVAIRYRVLRDGQRQIVSVLLPGDFAGANSCRFETALFSIKTLTPSVVHSIPLSLLAALVDRQPQLAAQLFWSFANDAAVIAERLITVGRRTAPERLAHFFLELLTRLRPLGLTEDDTFRLPLTQEMIADALGLSIPYVNRVLHQLQDEGLLLVKNQTFELRNIEELAALADFKQDYLRPRPMPAPIAAATSN
jgi:CRP-like cAMP-binding protein